MVEKASAASNWGFRSQLAAPGVPDMLLLPSARVFTPARMAATGAFAPCLLNPTTLNPASGPQLHWQLRPLLLLVLLLSSMPGMGRDGHLGFGVWSLGFGVWGLEHDGMTA